MSEEKRAEVLVVDDDPLVLRAISETLRRGGYRVTALADPVESITLAKDPRFDVVVTDINMPHLSGLDVLDGFKQARPDVEVIVITADATVETAIASVKAGAYDYLMKPFARMEDFTLTVEKAVERRALKMRARVLEEALSDRVELEGVIGQSAQMRAVFELVRTVAPSTATILIRGESGTGKEVVARAIHSGGPRREKPFVAVNCSALTETLLESELFGHVKGAFTGALSNKKGLFEAADGGTLFLDEIGDVPPATQVRLLRVLQEREVKPVGANEAIPVDVRVIAATHVDLEKAMSEGRFREDLFYRLSVIPLMLPPLRDRPDDIPLLAHHFLRRQATKHGKAEAITGISAEAVAKLIQHRWPGNVRELENVMERAVVLSPRAVLTVEDLPPALRAAEAPGESAAELSSLAHLPFAQAKSLTVNAFERRYLATLLERSGNNVSAAALAAGMDRSNFRRLLKEHGISRADSEREGAE